MSEWMNEWIDERINEWMNELTTEWKQKLEGMKESSVFCGFNVCVMERPSNTTDEHDLP